jgi:hypothetical protein
MQDFEPKLVTILRGGIAPQRLQRIAAAQDGDQLGFEILHGYYARRTRKIRNRSVFSADKVIGH